jgi:hypothetical protein
VDHSDLPNILQSTNFDTIQPNSTDVPHKLDEINNAFAHSSMDSNIGEVVFQMVVGNLVTKSVVSLEKPSYNSTVKQLQDMRTTSSRNDVQNHANYILANVVTLWKGNTQSQSETTKQNTGSVESTISHMFEQVHDGKVKPDLYSGIAYVPLADSKLVKRYRQEYPSVLLKEEPNQTLLDLEIHEFKSLSKDWDKDM